MGTFENTMKINSITMYHKVRCYCPLGKDFYTNQFKITFTPDKYICDYCDVEKYIDDLQNSILSIEDAVAQIYNWLNEMFNPTTLTVESYVDDATHFPVRIVKIKEEK